MRSGVHTLDRSPRFVCFNGLLLSLMDEKNAMYVKGLRFRMITCCTEVFNGKQRY